MELKQELSDLIAQGRLRQALDLALLKVEADHYRYSDLILLASRLSGIERDSVMGLMRDEDISREKNRITYALLELSDDLEE